MSEALTCQLPDLRGVWRKRSVAARHPDKNPLDRIERRSVLPQPCAQPQQLRENFPGAMAVRWMNFDPIQELARAPRMLVADGVVPSRVAGTEPPQRCVEIDAPSQAPGVPDPHVGPVIVRKRLQPGTECVCERRNQHGCVAEVQSLTPRSALATACATASLARPLNSESPPKPLSPLSSVAGSSPDMSRARPLGSK